jgi:hypothetical protein
VTATILALFGCQFDCICYSSFLSKRDETAFRALFEAFNISSNIDYGTLKDITWKLLKDYSSLSEQRIFLRENMEQASYGSQKVERIQKSPRVLLVDEVDIFFSDDVLGHAIMRPLVLKGKAISDALLYIWHQCTSLSSHSVLQCEQVKI